MNMKSEKNVNDLWFQSYKINTGAYNYNVEAVDALGCWETSSANQKLFPFKRLFDLTLSSHEFHASTYDKKDLYILHERWFSMNVLYLD